MNFYKKNKSFAMKFTWVTVIFEESTTGSDLSSAGRSSEASFSNGHRTNSLLASESPKAAQRRHQLENASGENLSIDSRAYDPDSLWKRDKPAYDI